MDLLSFYGPAKTVEVGVAVEGIVTVFLKVPLVAFLFVAVPGS